MPKLSLALIVTPTSKEAKRLDKCLSSVKGVFDEICITQAGPHPSEEVEAVIKKHNAINSFFTWKNDFAAARQFNFEQCTGDWIMWLDSDDLLKGAENIRKNVELAEQAKVTGLSTLYHYSHDANGNVEDTHWKLQIVKKGFYEWKGCIHEDLLPIKETKDARIHDVIRVHTATKADSERSLKRNIEILEEALQKEPNEPRHYFYLARCYLGIGDWNKVIDVVTTYLTLSSWPEERYDALNMLGEAYMRLGDTSKAIETHQIAILELEDAPDAYIFKARNYIQQEKWANALTNLEIAEQRDKTSVVLQRTALYDHDLYVMSAICLLNLGFYDDAVKAAERAYENRKTDQSKETLELAKTMQHDEDETKRIRALGLKLLDKPEELKKLLETVPAQIQDDPRILQLKFSAFEPRVWPEGSIVWMCGNALEDWDGNSTKKGGIGGSETAVIELAKRQAAAGREVTVYNRCGAPAGGVVIDGVTYKNFWEYDQRDHFDTIIIWRYPQYVDTVQNANKIIVDMHDVSNDAYFTPERLEKISKVHVKTNYHRSLYPSIPDEKIVVVGNGIDLSRFKETESKNKHRFIYTSSADRGLENILDVWPKIKAKLPKAELHVFYGWHSFVESNKHDPVLMDWVERMKAKLKQPGITNHGRVDQPTLAKEMLKSFAWLYPTQFPEIHCITALEMQAANVYPITSGYAALAETQASGVKIPGDPTGELWRERFLNEIIFAVENKDMVKEELQKGYEYAQACSWDNVVELWLKQT